MSNILHLIETGGPGGAENFLIRLAEQLSQLGHNNTVLLIKEGWLAQQLREKGIEVIVHSGSQDILTITRLIVSLVRNRKIDAVHSHEFLMNACNGIASIFTKAQAITTVHGKNYYGEKLQRRILYKLASKKTKMVAVSDDIKSQLFSKVGIGDAKVTVIENGIECSDYDIDEDLKNETRVKLGVGNKDIMILAVGNLYPVKGHKYLIDAVASLASRWPNLKVFIAGRGECELDLQYKIDKHALKDRVELLGFRDDVKALLMASDIFCMPSLSEGLPLSILEAMASSRPVVATDVGGVSQVVLDGDTGKLVCSENAENLAQALEELVADKGRREQMGAAGNSLVKSKFSMNHMVNKYMKLYFS